MSQHYEVHRKVYEELANQGVTASVDLSLEPDFQFLWLLKSAEGAKSILAFEAASKSRINSLLTLDFTDPIASALKRDTPRFVQIGRDPDRTIKKPEARQLAELDRTDALLTPMCPAMPIRNKILEIYGDALKGRVKVSLSPCWDMYLRNDHPGVPAAGRPD